jgi:transposase
METITMTPTDQRRAWVLNRLARGDLTMAEAAGVLGLSERQVWRLRAAFERAGPAGLVHGNRGRASPRRVQTSVAARVIELAQGRYAGCNDCHLAELLAEHDGIALGRVTVRRILRSAGIASPRRRRPPRHRSRRERMPQEGLLVQLDGSRHDWLEGRGPWLTLVGAIDDATGIVPAATFRAQEDAAGYLELLRTIVRRKGIPVAVYRDRHGIFEPVIESTRGREPGDGRGRSLSQVGRALVELGIESIPAASPQAKGRIERLWGTWQDRLVAELRLAGAHDRASANRVLAGFVPRFNRRFGVPPADPSPAWRARPRGLRLDRVCCFKYRRRVASDHTIRMDGQVLQLPPGPGRVGYAGRRVEVHVRLDGRIVAFDGERELVVSPAPPDASALRSRDDHRAGPSLAPSPAAFVSTPAPDHPWRTMSFGKAAKKRALTDSLIR